MDKHPPVVSYPDSNVVKLERQFFGDPEEKTEIIEFEKLLKFLQRYKYLLALMMILGAIAGYFHAANKTPFFRTSASIVVENDRMRYYVPKSFYETQQVVIKSLAVLEKAARSLSPVMINRMFAKPEGHWIAAYLDDLKSRAKEWLPLVGIEINTSSNSVSEKSESKPAARANYSERRIAKILQSRISVGFGSTQELLNISSISSDPLVAAVVANAVADAYIGFLVENRVSQTERAGQWLAERIADSRKRLSESEDALYEFQLKEQLLDLSTAKSLSSVKLDTVNSALLEAEQRYEDLSKRYGPKHPQLVEAKKQLLSARSQFGRESKKDLGTYESRSELAKLERAVKSNRELYDLFVFRFNEVDIGLDSVSSSI
jgi:uncharacterized protein involved in exopolysaccharide biosynthesis